MITTIKELQKKVIETAMDMGLEAHVKTINHGNYFSDTEIIVVDGNEYTNYEALDLWT